MGAAFSAIAHAFSKRLTSVSISSDHDIPNIYPFSSHPLINRNYASSDLKIKLEGIALSRFEKTELGSKWDLAIKYLRVCNKTEYYKSELLNCGKCEKCTRTMLTFQALGVLKMASAFPTQDVTVEQIDQCGELEPNTFFFWSQLIAPFAKMGRKDLVRAIERKIAYYHQAEKRKNYRKLYIEPIIELDQKMFGGTLRKFKRRVYSKGIYTNP